MDYRLPVLDLRRLIYLCCWGVPLLSSDWCLGPRWWMTPLSYHLAELQPTPPSLLLTNQARWRSPGSVCFTTTGSAGIGSLPTMHFNGLSPPATLGPVVIEVMECPRLESWFNPNLVVLGLLEACSGDRRCVGQ